MIDSGVDIVHGHPSHHPRPIEIYRKRIIFYGCSDFLNDYEGIRGYEQYRVDLVLMYFATHPANGDLVQLRMTPMQIRQMRLNRAAPRDVQWLADRLARINMMNFGSWVERAEDGSLFLRWE